MKGNCGSNEGETLLKQWKLLLLLLLLVKRVQDISVEEVTNFRWKNRRFKWM